MSYPGIYRGIVTSNHDPEERGRIRARVPDVMGDVVLSWAAACIPAGPTTHTSDATVGTEQHAHEIPAQVLPSPGDGVWIMFERGEVGNPVWLGTWASPGMLMPS